MAMPRVAELLFPILREALPGVQVVSRMPAAADRQYPILLVNRAGGNAIEFDLLDRATVVLQGWAKGTNADADAENIVLDARNALWSAYKDQRVVAGKGNIGYITETSGPSQLPSGIDDTARYQSMYSVRIRPAN